MEAEIGRVPVVSVVIRCRDEVWTLGSVLDAVLRQEGAPPFEVLVLDSGSTDGTLVLLERYPVRVEHLAADEFSYGRALNRGAELARGEVVVYLSAHCQPLDLHWLATLVAPFEDPKVVATFGRQVPVQGMNPIEAIATMRNFPAASPTPVLFSTASGAVRRAAVLARPFDEEIAIAEDHLWASDVPPSQCIAYIPVAAVTHSHPMTGRHWRSRFYAHGVAQEYARRRRGVDLPWRDPGDRASDIMFRRAFPFLRLVARLARDCEFRALAHVPSYALARTVWYARGVKDGALRYAEGQPVAAERC